MISANSIVGNNGLGIDLAPAGRVTCHPSAFGPDGATDCPVITATTQTAVTGSACAGCTVEIFATGSPTSFTHHGRARATSHP